MMQYCVADGAECETLRIRNSDYLHVIKAVHVILMEWACNDAMQEVLVRCAIVSLLFQELHTLNRSLHIDSESDKVWQLLRG